MRYENTSYRKKKAEKTGIPRKETHLRVAVVAKERRRLLASDPNHNHNHTRLPTFTFDCVCRAFRDGKCR